MSAAHALTSPLPRPAREVVGRKSNSGHGRPFTRSCSVRQFKLFVPHNQGAGRLCTLRQLSASFVTNNARSAAAAYCQAGSAGVALNWPALS